jgi:hypothetical protein
MVSMFRQDADDESILDIGQLIGSFLTTTDGAKSVELSFPTADIYFTHNNVITGYREWHYSIIQ